MFVRMPFNKGNILIKKFYVKDTEVAGKKIQVKNRKVQNLRRLLK